MTPPRNTDSVLIRRTAVALAVLVTALGASACGSSAAGSGPAGATPTSTAAAGQRTTAQVCQDLSAQVTSLAAPLLPLLQGNPTGAQLQTGIAQVQTAVTTWAQSLQAEAAIAQDSAVAGDLKHAATQMTATVATAFSGDQNAMALQTAVLQIQTAASGLYLDCPQLPKLSG